MQWLFSNSSSNHHISLRKKFVILSLMINSRIDNVWVYSKYHQAFMQCSSMILAKIISSYKPLTIWTILNFKTETFARCFTKLPLGNSQVIIQSGRHLGNLWWVLTLILHSSFMIRFCSWGQNIKFFHVFMFVLSCFYAGTLENLEKWVLVLKKEKGIV